MLGVNSFFKLLNIIITSGIDVATKRAPGRPRKSADEQLEQFSIRLTPRLKLGLEMLAKVQGRSLSQAVEWAIKVGLNTQRLPPNDKYMFLGELLDDLADRDEFKRLLTLYLHAPSLMSFEEAAAMQFVNESYEWNQACEADRPGEGDEHRMRYYEYAHQHWPSIKAEAARKAENGESLTNGFIGLLTGNHFET